MSRKTLTMKLNGVTFSICSGHIDHDAFKDAFHAEGWAKHVVFLQQSLRHEWWTRGQKGWLKCERDDDNALPVTVLEW